jgi:polyhydroxybutyrate depolymerase
MNHLFTKTTWLTILILFLSGCGKVASTSAAACKPGTYDEEMTSGDQVRQYRLHIPPGYQPGMPIPLVFGFHGADSTGVQFEAYSGFSNLADQAGFIAVYPQGLGELSNWDTMPNSTDVPFVRDLLDALETRCSIDPARVYASGHSRGGGMANRLGCELSDRLAAIGPVSGDYENSENCTSSRPVAVVAFHGTLDPVIPYNGFGLPGALRESYTRIGTPIPTWAASWAERNGCNTKSSNTFEEGLLSDQKWSGCQAGADVLLYTIAGGTHDWPGTYDAARIIWEFFSQHPFQ